MSATLDAGGSPAAGAGPAVVGVERRAVRVVLAATLVVIATGVAIERSRRTSERRRPARDGEVVAHVPARASDPAAAARAALARASRAAPDDLSAAVRLAEADIEAARVEADPRFLGRAEAALAPWWAASDVPPAVLLLRATIRQSRHDFAAALVDLDHVTRLAPDEPQGWLTRAAVLTVRARYEDALASCVPLERLASPLVRSACRAPALALSGHPLEAIQALSGALAPETHRAEAAWARSLLGDLALWAGDETGAEVLQRAALALDPRDRYARAALCDLLLDGGRYAEVLELTAGREADDALLLRRALARAAASALPTAGRPSDHTPAAGEREITLMEARFAASRLRGDRVHQREESRFVLAVRHDAAAALHLAEESWQVQREPADARVLLEAALAAHDRRAARPVLDWMARTGIAWPRLRALAAALGGAS